MKSNKIAIILSAFVILMMCLSVVSAAVENAGDNGTDEITNVGKAGTPTLLMVDVLGDDMVIELRDNNTAKGIANATVNLKIVKDGTTVVDESFTTDANGEVFYSYKFTPGEYNLTCTFEGEGLYDPSSYSDSWTERIPTQFYVDVQPFGDQVLSAQLVDMDGNPIGNAPISVSLYDANGYFIKDTPMTTDAIGLVEYDISKLAKGKYSAIFRFEGDDTYADTTSDNLPFTIDAKDPVDPVDPVDPKKDPKDVDMEDTGAPIVALALGLLAVAGIGYRKY